MNYGIHSLPVGVLMSYKKLCNHRCDSGARARGKLPNDREYFKWSVHDSECEQISQS